VATLDRPEDLRECLSHLLAQETNRRVEIIVVDNHPASGLTPPVIAEFQNVRLVTEPRQGLAYARNKGFLASRGEIVIATDDDVIAPPGWLEQLLIPFVNPEVMIVTGNVQPRQIETEAQRLFESYGGLGRGDERRVASGEWFRQCRSAVPTWSLGATANAAFRASIFNHAQIGLMDEALGPGMPSGVGEDTYLFYKVLKAGYTIVYEPGAWVWHKHRRDLPALRRQIFNYSKGHVAYHLTTLLRDGDWRAAINLALLLPGTHLRRALRRLLGRSDYPLSLILLEAAGNLAGPWALWRSRRRVRREGPSRVGGVGRTSGMDSADDVGEAAK
jgi:glycosyltransferase involved in cell wall biosynthesis